MLADDQITVIKADLNDTIQCNELVELLNVYAKDIMGGGESLAEYTQLNLASELRKRPTAHVFLCYIALDEKKETKKKRKIIESDGTSANASQQGPDISNCIDRSLLTPAGVAICFEGFSTFACKPLLNIHDLCVKAEFRRRGLAMAMLMYIETFARSIGCCKLTLEVLSGNIPAKKAYEQAGFEGYELDPTAGFAEFWQKKIVF